MKLTRAEVIVRAVMWLCLVAVGAGAAVLSFHGLRGLGVMAKYADWSWVLPIVIDAGALAGTLVWLGRWAPQPARVFGQWMSLTLLGMSVVGNGLSHGFAAAHPGQSAAQIDAGVFVVVAVSAAPPAVLGAVVHLAVLATGQKARTGGQSQRRVAEQVPVREEAAPANAVSEPAPQQKPVAMSDPGKVDDFLQWAAELGHTPSTYEVRQRMGCGHNRAKKLLDELDRVSA